jgi:hypothetical protein
VDTLSDATAQARAQVPVLPWARPLRLVVAYALVVLAGFAWGHAPAVLAFAPLVFVGWWLAPCRLHAWVVASLYHAVAARMLVVGGARYFAVPLEHALVLVLGGAALAGVPWAVFWSRPGPRNALGWRFARVVGLLTLSALPPLASLTVMSPIVASGMWFPHAGIAGLVAFAALGALMGSRVRATDGWWKCVVCWALCSLLVWCRAGWMPTSERTDPELRAVSTSIVTSRPDVPPVVAQWQVAKEAISLAARSEGRVLVLPESVGGEWRPGMARVWAPLAQELAREDRLALVGATLVVGPAEYQAAAVLLRPGEAAIYRQRLPMPVAMWKPWTSTSPRFDPAWTGPGTMDVRGRKIGILICWEMGAAWSVLGSVLSGAEVLVGLSNLDWLRGTGGAEAEQQALQSWGTLFDVPTLLAGNL